MEDPDDATLASRDQEIALLRGLLASGRAADVVQLLDGWTPRELATHPETLVLLCDAHLALGATDASIVAARMAIEAAGAGPIVPAASAALAVALSRRADRDGLAEARRALDMSPPVRGRHDAVAARVHHADGVLRLREGRLEDARLALLDALASATVCGDDARRAMVQDSLGIASARLGDPLRALAHYDESLRIKRLLGDVGGAAITHGNRGRLLLAEGRAGEALAEFDADLEMCGRTGDGFGAVVAMDGRGIALTELRRFEEAGAALSEALRSAESGGHGKQAALCVKDLAVLAERRGRLDDARRLGADAVARFEAMGNVEGAGFARTVLGRISFRTGAAEEARDHLTRAVELLSGTLRADLLADALVRLAEATPDRGEAARRLDSAAEIAREHFLRDVARDVRAARERLDATSPGDHLRTSRNTLGFGRDRREFRLVERLGKGGQGEAWKALDVATGRMLVIKRQPLDDPSEEGRARVEVAMREFEAAMRLDHRGVVRVHEVERTGSELLLAMDLLPGASLRTRIPQGAREPAMAWLWIADLAAAVDALHAAGIVHRDLKPENVVFDAEDRPVVIDFGLALVAGRGDAFKGRIVGTPGYAAPEQWARGAIDRRADLFALGVIAIEVLTGANFLLAGSGAKSIAEVYVLMQDAPRIGSLAAGIRWPAHVPDAARTALLRLVAPAATDRPASAAAAMAEAGAE